MCTLTICGYRYWTKKILAWECTPFKKWLKILWYKGKLCRLRTTDLYRYIYFLQKYMSTICTQQVQQHGFRWYLCTYVQWAVHSSFQFQLTGSVFYCTEANRVTNRAGASCFPKETSISLVRLMGRTKRWKSTVVGHPRIISAECCLLATKLTVWLSTDFSVNNYALTVICCQRSSLK
jgi:hypothetical protein